MKISKPEYELTQKEMNMLREIAAKLPRVKRYNKQGKPVKSRAVVKFYGSSLIKQGIMRWEDGTPIIPEKKYRMHKPVVVNHLANLIDNYKHEGQSGVDKYVESAKKAWYRQQSFAVKLRIFWAGLLKQFGINS